MLNTHIYHKEFAKNYFNIAASSERGSSPVQGQCRNNRQMLCIQNRDLGKKAVMTTYWGFIVTNSHSPRLH